MKIRASGEDYLETILILKKKKAAVKSVDIVTELGYSKSSVSRAVNLLKDKGYIVIGDGGFIEFTQSGLDYSTQVLNRHKILKQYLCSIGVDEQTADEDACRIEHIISDKTFAAIKKIVENI